MKHIFLIDSYKRTEGIRKKIESLSLEDPIIFNLEYPGHETSLVERVGSIFSNERLRFYICGNSCTFRRAINASFDLDRCEFAYCPLGKEYYFLDAFSCHPEVFHRLENLVNGDVVNLDYMRMDQSKVLTAVSFGFRFSVFKYLNVFRRFRCYNLRVFYRISFFLSLFFFRPIYYNISLGGVEFKDKYLSVIVGNTNIFSTFEPPFETASPSDGLLDIMLCKAPTTLHEKILLYRCTKKYDPVIAERYVSYHQSRRIDIHSELERISVSQDMHYQNTGSAMIDIISGRLRIVVPKGTFIKNRRS